MRVQTTYIADDGTEFDTEAACLAHEAKIPHEKSLRDLLQCIDAAAHDIDPYEYGVPYEGAYAEPVVKVVREWLEANGFRKEKS